MQLFDDKRRQLAAEYQKEKKVNNRYSLVIKLLFLIIFFGFSLELKVYNIISEGIVNWEIRLLAYIGGLFLVYTILDTSLSYIFNYRLNYRYNLTEQKISGWLGDQVKSFILNLGVIYPAARVFLFLIKNYSQTWWIYFTIIASVFTVVLTLLVPVIILPMFFKLEPYPEGSLKERITNLVKQAGIKFDEIYEINLSTRVNYANAAVIGLGKTRKIALGDKLQENYSEEEIEAVMAHEIGHHVHKDMFKNILVQSLMILLTSYFVYYLWPIIAEFWGYVSFHEAYTLPLLYVLWKIFSWLVSPIQLYYNRFQERKADEFACKMISSPKPFASALARLADESLAELNYGYYKLLFKASHPSIGDRIDLLNLSDR